MALVSGVRSSLNPNAPLFIPAKLRQVEDFSPEWWEFVKTSTPFRDYWLSQHQDEDFDGRASSDYADHDDEIAFDLADSLPEFLYPGFDEEFAGEDFCFEEELLVSEAKGETKQSGVIVGDLSVIDEGLFVSPIDKNFEKPVLSTKVNAKKSQNRPLKSLNLNRLEMDDAKAILKSLTTSKSPNERRQTSPAGLAKYHEMPTRCMSPKSTPRRINQPR